MAVSRFVDVSEKEINIMKENAIPRNTKHATEFGVTLNEVSCEIVLNITKKPFKFPWKCRLCRYVRVKQNNY